MPTLTPSSTSSGIAGFGLGLLLWSFLFKCETIAKLFGLKRWVKRDTVFNWIADNGGLFLAGTATVNLSIHGTSHPEVVPMTLCMELVNILMVLILKIRRWTGRQVQYV